MALKHTIEYSILRTVIFTINLLPVSAILKLSGFLGHIAWIFFPFRLNVAHYNLSKVFPEKGHREKMRILKRTYLQFAKTFGLVFILHRKELQNLVENTVITGREHIDAALAQGKGAILTTYHGCWFEAYFAWFNRFDLPTSLIYQKQANPLSDNFFVRQRSRYGTSLSHLTSKAGMEAFQQALTDNRLLIVSLDQRYSGRGTDIMFFNTPLRCAKGSAVLHLRTEAPVLTSVYYMKDNTLHIDFGTVELPEYDGANEENIQDICTRSITQYESYIRKYPEQWFSLFHKLWMKRGYPEIKRSFRDIFIDAEAN